MNITLENGDTKSLVLIKDLSYIPLCEEGKGFKSTDYSGYKPYQLPKPSRLSEKYYDLMITRLMGNVICVTLGELVAEATILQDIFANRKRRNKQNYLNSRKMEGGV